MLQDQMCIQMRKEANRIYISTYQGTTIVEWWLHIYHICRNKVNFQFRERQCCQMHFEFKTRKFLLQTLEIVIPKFNNSLKITHKCFPALFSDCRFNKILWTVLLSKSNMVIRIPQINSKPEQNRFKLHWRRLWIALHKQKSNGLETMWDSSQFS